MVAYEKWLLRESWLYHDIPQHRVHALQRMLSYFYRFIVFVWTGESRADKGWAVKRALRCSFNVWCRVGLARALFQRFRRAWKPAKFFFFANRKSYFLSVISGYNVKYINSFHNSISKQFHMFVSVCLYVKLVGRIMPKFEFNLKMLNASSFH